MRVKAIEVGFHGKLREVGEEFDVRDGEKGSWFVKIDGEQGKADGGAQTKPGRQARATSGAQTKPGDSSTGQSLAAENKDDDSQ